MNLPLPDLNNPFAFYDIATIQENIVLVTSLRNLLSSWNFQSLQDVEAALVQGRNERHLREQYEVELTECRTQLQGLKETHARLCQEMVQCVEQEDEYIEVVDSCSLSPEDTIKSEDVCPPAQSPVEKSDDDCEVYQSFLSGLLKFVNEKRSDNQVELELFENYLYPLINICNGISKCYPESTVPDKMQIVKKLLRLASEMRALKAVKELNLTDGVSNFCDKLDRLVVEAYPRESAEIRDRIKAEQLFKRMRDGPIRKFYLKTVLSEDDSYDHLKVLALNMEKFFSFEESIMRNGTTIGDEDSSDDDTEEKILKRITRKRKHDGDLIIV